MRDYNELSETLILKWGKKKEEFFATNPRCSECRKPITSFTRTGKCTLCCQRSYTKAFRERNPDYYKNHKLGIHTLAPVESVSLINPFQETKIPTKKVIKERAREIRLTYMKRARQHVGSFPNNTLFLAEASLRIFDERKFNEIGSILDFLRCYDVFEREASLYLAKNTRWRKESPAFKEIEYQEAWDDLRTSSEAGRAIARSKQRKMSNRDIQLRFRISKGKLKNLTGFIRSTHAYLRKEKDSKYFTFN